MASGDFLFALVPAHALPTTSSNATLDTISMTGTGANNSQELILSFPAGSDTFAVFPFVWPENYGASASVDLTVGYSTDGTNTSNQIEFEISFLNAGDTDDWDNKTWSNVTTIADTPSTATANVLDITATSTITNTNLNSPAAGEKGWMLVQRDDSVDGGNNNDAVQLHFIHVHEN